jgi:hypothetical protein
MSFTFKRELFEGSAFGNAKSFYESEMVNGQQVFRPFWKFIDEYMGLESEYRLIQLEEDTTFSSKRIVLDAQVEDDEKEEDENHRVTFTLNKADGSIEVTYSPEKDTNAWAKFAEGEPEPPQLEDGETHQNIKDWLLSKGVVSVTKGGSRKTRSRSRRHRNKRTRRMN